MNVVSKKLENGDLEIVLTFEPCDQMCLEHDLLDIVEWYEKGPAQEKIYSCKKRLLKESENLLLKNPEFSSMSIAEYHQVMKDEKRCIEFICKNPEYKNRKAREK